MWQEMQKKKAMWGCEEISDEEWMVTSHIIKEKDRNLIFHSKLSLSLSFYYTYTFITFFKWFQDKKLYYSCLCVWMRCDDQTLASMTHIINTWARPLMMYFVSLSSSKHTCTQTQPHTAYIHTHIFIFFIFHSHKEDTLLMVKPKSV